MRIKQRLSPLPMGFHSWLPLLLLSLCSTASVAGEKLDVVGYGVKGCPQYLAAYEGWETGVDAEILEYIRYREWLAGLVTGLTLATGMDVLRGIDVESAMRRIQLDCDERGESDFFGASMRLIRLISEPVEGSTETEPKE